MQYTTKETLRAYLGVTTNEASDTILENLIKRVTAQFDKYLGRNLAITEYTEYLNAEGDTILVVDKGPITEIQVLKQDDADGESIVSKRMDGNLVYLSSEVEGTIYIGYKAGYPSIAEIADVEQACLETCSDLWNNTPSSGNEANIKSKQIETLSKSYFSKDEMSGGIAITFRDTLDNYKIFNPMIV